MLRNRYLISALALLLGGCQTAHIGQSSFFPRPAIAPNVVLSAPPGYRMEEAMIDLPGLGQVHTIRLDNPGSDATLIYAGGNASFAVTASVTAAALAGATHADIILYDYPGRGGTSIPATIDAAISFGPAFVTALRSRGWIGSGALFAYGLSFGGSQVASIVRAGGFDGAIIEGSVADVAAVGRNFVPGMAKPFVRVQVDPALARFDYLAYMAAAKVPILLLSSQDDRYVHPENARDFADALRKSGLVVTSLVVPGGHGSATRQPAAIEAISAFVSKYGHH